MPRLLVMPFGKYIGKPLSMIPNAYLEWYCGLETGNEEIKEAMADIIHYRLQSRAANNKHRTKGK